ncbi:MAG TPA: MFS transporter [Spirochaetota bacterium]
MKKYIRRWNEADVNLRFFLIGAIFLGINAGVLSTTFNNYLNDMFHISERTRGILEVPREIPGFVLIAITGVLAAYSLRGWAIIVGVISGVGVIGLGFMSPSIYIMTMWMMLWSMGDHLYMPVESTMGLHFAKEGKQGKRLGQLAGARNLAMIIGALAVYLVASFLTGKKLYSVLYLCAGICAIFSVVSFSRVKVHHDKGPGKRRFIFRREYGFFYVLNILFGARKQIFLTFAPWVLVTVFNTTPTVMAALIMIASIAGVLFRQVFGMIVDRFGEKKMFIADALILFCICGGFAFSKNVYLLYFLYIADNLMFSTRIARTTYLNKIAKEKSDIPPTISLGITMDHFFSMIVPIMGGVLWAMFGYSKVFFAASGVALLSLIVAFVIQVPANKKHGA